LDKKCYAEYFDTNLSPLMVIWAGGLAFLFPILDVPTKQYILQYLYVWIHNKNCIVQACRQFQKFDQPPEHWGTYLPIFKISLQNIKVGVQYTQQYGSQIQFSLLCLISIYSLTQIHILLIYYTSSQTFVSEMNDHGC
jgi:hypothetical protein